MSIVMPVTVRSHQYGRIALTESIQSAWAISMKPCCNPCAVSTSVIAPMLSTMSQKPVLASRKLVGRGPSRVGTFDGHGPSRCDVERVTRGQT